MDRGHLYLCMRIRLIKLGVVQLCVRPHLLQTCWAMDENLQGKLMSLDVFRTDNPE